MIRCSPAVVRSSASQHGTVWHVATDVTLQHRDQNVDPVVRVSEPSPQSKAARCANAEAQTCADSICARLSDGTVHASPVTTASRVTPIGRTLTSTLRLVADECSACHADASAVDIRVGRSMCVDQLAA